MTNEEKGIQDTTVAVDQYMAVHRLICPDCERPLKKLLKHSVMYTRVSVLQRGGGIHVSLL